MNANELQVIDTKIQADTQKWCVIDIPLGILCSVDGRHVILALLPACPRGTGLADGMGLRSPSCSICGIILVLLRRCRSAPREAMGDTSIPYNKDCEVIGNHRNND